MGSDSRKLIIRICFGVAAAAAFVMLISDSKNLTQLALGVGSGALISAIAIAIVLTYRGSGVVNFATGAVALYVAYTYNGLRSEGRLYLPPLPNPLSIIEGVVNKFGDWFNSSSRLDLPDIPTRVSFGGPLTLISAMTLALLIAALIGFLLHVLVFRPLRSGPPLAKVIASVGLFVYFQSIIPIRFGSTALSVKRILPVDPVRFTHDIAVPQNQIYLAIIVTILAVLLWAVFHYTRFGLATRAASENEKGAVVLGFSPEFLAGINWVLSTVIVSLLAILVAPSLLLDQYTIALLVVPALGAALLGSFTSFGITVAAGFGTGMLQALIKYWGTKSWFPRTTLPEAGVGAALPFVIVIIALSLRGKSLPTRGSISSGRLPFAPSPKRVALPMAIFAVFFAAIFLWAGFEWRQAGINTLVTTAICLSLVVITGFVGQISLAHMTLAGVAGFALSKFAAEQHWPFPIGPILGAFVATGFGLLVALPALRVRGVNLAIVTFAAAVAIEELLFRSPRLTNGKGTVPIPPPSIGGQPFGPGSKNFAIFNYNSDGKIPNLWFGMFCLVVVVMLALLVSNTRRSNTGRRFLAVRSNERAAAAAGISVPATKLLAFGLSAFIAGLGGSLSGYRFGSVSPQYFGALASLTFLTFAYLGGISSVGGAIAAGFIGTQGLVFTGLHRWFHIPDKYTIMIGGIGVVFTAIRNPEGIAGAFRQVGAMISKRFGRSPSGGKPFVHAGGSH